MQQGWISIHRRLQDHWLWQDKPFARGQAWIDILLMVNHEDKEIFFDGEMIEIKKGSTITSIRHLSECWGWSRSKVTSFLNSLVKQGMLLKNSDTKKTVLTVINYGFYQKSLSTEKPQKSHRPTSEKPQTNTNNNDNNDNNDNKYSRASAEDDQKRKIAELRK